MILNRIREVDRGLKLYEYIFGSAPFEGAKKQRLLCRNYAAWKDKYLLQVAGYRNL
jgi:hypothetical protein